MEYLDLVKKAEQNNIKVYDYKLTPDLKGLYFNGNIAINEDIETLAEKKCVLAEELGHHFMNAGNILDQDNIVNIKQEKLGRSWAIKKLVGITDLINAFNDNIRSRYELAEYLDVTEEFIEDAIEYYTSKYGEYYQIDNYVVYFNPLSVLEVWE